MPRDSNEEERLDLAAFPESNTVDLSVFRLPTSTSLPRTVHAHPISDQSAGKSGRTAHRNIWYRNPGMETPEQLTDSNMSSSILGLQSLQTPENVAEATSGNVKRGRKPKKGRIYNFMKRKSGTQSGAADELPQVAVDDDHQRFQSRDPSTTGKHETPIDSQDRSYENETDLSLTNTQPAGHQQHEAQPEKRRRGRPSTHKNQKATSLQASPRSSPTHQHEPDAEVVPSCVKVVNRNLGEDENASDNHSGNSTLHRLVELPLVFVSIPLLNPRPSASCHISVLPTSSPPAPVLLSPPSSDSSSSDDGSGEEFNPANEPRNSDTVSESSDADQSSPSQVESPVSLVAGEGTPRHRHEPHPPPLSQDLPSSSSSSDAAGSDDSSDDPEYRPELDPESGLQQSVCPNDLFSFPLS
ncbi:Hypothetical predicted protein [Cloeon dipterum]|uniref:Uncharacterized protein n=1 Tax=Cloeon dipterum TaxID=197152 RepID=A0A8S1DKY1_9INSE|nr:Hypothetical predicted protein [Cloeon dipterum]